MNDSVIPSLKEEVVLPYEPPSWLIKIEFINQFIRNNNVLISVLGEHGSGKTTFANRLKSKLPQNMKSVLFTATSLFDRDILLNQLCSKLDMDGKSSITEVINDLNERKTPALILLDNAEKIPEELIIEILDALRLQGENGYCHVCLFSAFSLVKMTSRLARETYKDMIHSIELQPLSLSETKALVLSQKPLLPETALLTDEALEQFYDLTEGNMASIHSQMACFFSRHPKRYLIEGLRYLPFAIVPLVAVGLGYFLFSQSQTMEPLSDQLLDSNMKAIAIELPLTSVIPGYQVASIHEPMQMVSLEKAEVQLANRDEGAIDNSLVVMDKVVSVPKTVASTQMASLVPSVKPNAVEEKKVAAVDESNVKPKPVGQAGGYTIQLAASRDKADLVRMLARYPSLEAQHIRRFKLKGASWYVLTVGEYSNRQEANKAMNRLSQQLASYKPWIRSMSNLSLVG